MKHIVHPGDRASRERRIRKVTQEKLDVVEMLGSVKYADAVPSLLEMLGTRPLIAAATR